MAVAVLVVIVGVAVVVAVAVLVLVLLLGLLHRLHALSLDVLDEFGDRHAGALGIL